MLIGFRALMGVGGAAVLPVTLAIITVLAHFTPMSVFVLNMTTMLGLGMGIGGILAGDTLYISGKGDQNPDGSHPGFR